MKNEKLSLELLPIALDELKSMYSQLVSTYERLKSKFVLFTSGQLAYLAYLYSSTEIITPDNQIKRLFFPIELSSQIFYVTGLILSLSSLFFLFQGFLIASWEFPPQSKDMKNLNFRSKFELLTYLRDEYFDAIQLDVGVYRSRKSLYSKGLLCLVIGDVILFVIRFFGNIQL